MIHARAWGLVVVFMGLIFWSSAMPGKPPQSPGEPERLDFVSVACRYFDKPIHVTVYAGLAALVFRALSAGGMSFRRAAILAVVICSVFGASDEWHQSFTPHRESSLDDWRADTAGAFCMILLIYLHHFRSSRKPMASP